MIRMVVDLPNFHEIEANCTCGCGKRTDPNLMIRLQAFIFYLEAVYKSRVRCNITGPARCVKRQAEVYGVEGKESYHLGMSRKGKPGELGAALDIICDYTDKHGSRVTIPKAELAKHAIASKLFGGVIHKIYGDESRFLHVDLGPIREA